MCGVYGAGSSCRYGARRGLPGWSPDNLAVPAPGGGLAVFVACLPCLLLAFLPPSPHPLPNGKGEIFVILCKGLRPLHPRGWRGAALVRRALAAPGGGLPGWSPDNLAIPAPGGGLPSLSTVYPAFCLLSCPHPPNPLPGGKGEIFVILLQGASPLASPGQAERGTGLVLRKQFGLVSPEDAGYSYSQ